MDRKTWLAVISLGLSLATNYVQHGSVLAEQEQTTSTAAALSVLAHAVEEGKLCE